MPETEAVPTPKDGEKEEPKKSDSPKEHVEEEPIDEKDQSEQKENINNGVEEEAKVKNESEENGTEAAEDTDDDSKKWDFTRGPRNRVKLYVLCEQRVWDDRGTGHVACLPLPDKSGFHAIVVRLEANEKNVLESKILLDTVYQKQQETLIVWSESDTTDLALSFQEKTGCEELWTRICEVQGKDPKECVVGGNNENDDGEEGESSDGASGSGSDRGRRGNGSGSNNAYNNRAKQLSQEQMPPFEMARLQEIEYIFNQGAGSGIAKEKLATAIESLDYIPKMCDVFKMCEDIENKKGLECIFHICKHMFMLNKNSIIEILLHDDNLKDIIGILEYDPINKEPKPHREFLYEKAHFKQILPMSNDALRDKIHQAYRVQYVQDVCLPAPSLFEENNLSVLNSYIFFLRVDIVTMVQESEDLMTALFKELVDPVCLPARRRELSAFLKELCALSGALQQTGTNSKEAFYKALLNHDVLRAIEPTFRGKDGLTKQTMTEILHMVSEYNSQAVREFIIHQSKDKADDDILLNLLLKHIVTDRDPELSSATMMLQVMRLLLDPEHMAQKGEKNDFLHIFYSKCLPTLTASLLEIVDGVTKPKKDDYHTAKKLSLVLRLLNFCVSHHALPMRTFVIRRDLLNKVLVLLNSRHHFLALYALKLLRSVIQQKDEFYYNYVTEKNVFDKVVECLEDNGRRNNLLNSSVIELFEFMRQVPFQEDMKPVIYHIVERHGERLSEHNYVKTFRDLKTRYDQHKNREEELRRQREERESGSSYSRREEEEMRWKSREREMEKEEQWFDNDDDEDEEEEEKEKEEKEREEKKRQERSKAPGPSPGRKSGAEPMFPKMKSAKQDEEEAGVFGGGSTPKLSSALGLGALANAPKIVIKVIQSEGTRSRSPSPGTIPPREDEVSSSHEASSSTSSAATAAGATSPSGAAQKRPAPATSPSGDVPKKGLVEYDDSDSDPEEATEETGGVTGDDAVPSSSTGSPTMDETECAAAAATTGTTAGGGGGGG
ncbi:smk-1, partial [Pristionchus pacificus]